MFCFTAAASGLEKSRQMWIISRNSCWHWPNTVFCSIITHSKYDLIENICWPLLSNTFATLCMYLKTICIKKCKQNIAKKLITAFMKYQIFQIVLCNRCMHGYAMLPYTNLKMEKCKTSMDHYPLQYIIGLNGTCHTIITDLQNTVPYSTTV